MSENERQREEELDDLQHRQRPAIALNLSVLSADGEQYRRKEQAKRCNTKMVYGADQAAGTSITRGDSVSPAFFFTGQISQRSTMNLYSLSAVSPTDSSTASSSCSSSSSNSTESSPESRVANLSQSVVFGPRYTEIARPRSSTPPTARSPASPSGHASRSPLRSILRTGSAKKPHRSRSAPNDRRKDDTAVNGSGIALRSSTRSVVFGDERGLPLVSVFHYQRGHGLRRYSSEPGPLSQKNSLPRSVTFDDMSDDELTTSAMTIKSHRSTRGDSKMARKEPTTCVLSQASGQAVVQSEVHLTVPVKFYLDGVQPSLSSDFSCRLGSNNVCLESLHVGDHGEVLGQIQVANLCYQKSVKVRLTVDNWENCVEVIAKFSSTLGKEVDRFTFTYRLPALGMSFKRSIQNSPRSSFIVAQFAVRYVVSGSEFWDNNFNRNYRILRELAPATPWSFWAGQMVTQIITLLVTVNAAHWPFSADQA